MLDGALTGHTIEQDTELEAGFARLAAPTLQANTPILAYRDDLLTHLPVSGDAVFARLDDLTVRATDGTMTNPDLAAFDTTLQAWLAAGGDPQTIDRLRTAIRKLGVTRLPDSYTGTLRPEPHPLAWQHGQVAFNPAKIKEWQKMLADAANRPAGGEFKFKK